MFIPGVIGPYASAFASLCTSLYPILPASRSGKISTLALPATLLPGALYAAISGTNAASGCNSPSILRYGALSLAILYALYTLSTSACLALPFVEYESIATYGSPPTRYLKDSAEAMAIPASFSGSGFCSRPQSPNRKVPLYPYSQSGTTIMKNAETRRLPGFALTSCNAGRSVLAVE